MSYRIHRQKNRDTASLRQAGRPGYLRTRQACSKTQDAQHPRKRKAPASGYPIQLSGGTTMIEVFYKLKRLPFQKDINPKDMFVYAASQELARRLEHMKQKRGIMLITGTPGTGKTLHIRAFVEKLNPNLFKP